MEEGEERRVGGLEDGVEDFVVPLNKRGLRVSAVGETHFERIERVEMLAAEEVREALEAERFVPDVHRQDARQEGHSLHVPDVRPIERVRQQQLPHHVVQRLPAPEEPQRHERPLQILVDQPHRRLLPRQPRQTPRARLRAHSSMAASSMACEVAM